MSESISHVAIVEDSIGQREERALSMEPSLMPRLLRMLGAVLVTASASTFLFQQWSRHGDLVRYFLLLGHTVAIGLLGLFCAARLREARSARTLFALALSAVPIHFAVLGALSFSRLGTAPESLPDAARWVAPSLAGSLLATLAALAFLLPLTQLAFMTLARSHASALTRAMLLASAALLVPVRAPVPVSLLLFGLTLALLGVDVMFFAKAASLRTFEGRLSRALCFLPALFLAGRTLIFYDPTRAFYAALLLCAGYLWFELAPRVVDDASGLAQSWALGPTIVASFLLRSVVAHGALMTAAFCLLLTLFTLPMALRAVRGSGLYVTTVGLVTCLALLADLVLRDSATAALFALLGGAATAFAATATKRLGALIAGAVTALIAALHEVTLAITLESLRHWGSLAAVGLTLILAAALLERHGAALTRRMRALRSQLATWSW